MPATWEKYLEAEAKLAEAISAARGATKDVHRAIKDQRVEIRAQIELEIAKQVTVILDDVRRTAETQVAAVIDEIRTDWRAKLGLDA